MKDGNQSVPIFRSFEPDAFARAVALLKAAGIPFRVLDRNEGGSKMPRCVHWIIVTGRFENEARRVVESVPTELILPKHHTVLLREDRVFAWIQVILLAIVIVAAVALSLFNNR